MYNYPCCWGLPWWLSWWKIHLQCGRPEFNPWVGKIPWRRERLPTPIFWPGECHELYSPWGHKELDTTERFYILIAIAFSPSLLPIVFSTLPGKLNEVVDGLSLSLSSLKSGSYLRRIKVCWKTSQEERVIDRWEQGLLFVKKRKTVESLQWLTNLQVWSRNMAVIRFPFIS